MASPLLFYGLSCLEQAFEEVIVHQIGHSDLQLGADVHGALDGEHGALVAGPGAAADAVVHIPVEHHAQTAVASLAAVKHHTEAAVHHFTPANAAAVVDRDPRGSTEAVANDVLHSHIGATVTAVVNVAGLAEGAVRTAHIVVVTTKDDRCGNLTFLDGLVKAGGNLSATLAVGIEDTGLAANHQVVLLGALNPLDIVVHLLLNLGRSCCGNLAQHLHSDMVALVEVFGLAAGAHPTEGTEAVVEAHRTHDVLHV